MLVFINVWSTNEMMMKTQPGRHVEGKMKGWMWWRTGEGGMDDARAQTSKKRSTWPEGSRALRGEAEALRTEEGEVVGSTGGCWDSMRERERDRQTDIQKVRESANKRRRAQQNYRVKKKVKDMVSARCFYVCERVAVFCEREFTINNNFFNRKKWTLGKLHTTIQKVFISFSLKRWIHLFSKDTLYWLQVSVKHLLSLYEKEHSGHSVSFSVQ